MASGAAGLGAEADKCPFDVAERKDLFRDKRRDLFRDERHALWVTAGLVAVITAVAIGTILRGHVEAGIALEGIAFGSAAAILVLGQRFAGLRVELAHAEAQLRYAEWVVEVVGLLQSIDGRLARIERQAEKEGQS
jgi:hypothetical protein